MEAAYIYGWIGGIRMASFMIIMVIGQCMMQACCLGSPGTNKQFFFLFFCPQ